MYNCHTYRSHQPAYPGSLPLPQPRLRCRPDGYAGFYRYWWKGEPCPPLHRYLRITHRPYRGLLWKVPLRRLPALRRLLRYPLLYNRCCWPGARSDRSCHLSVHPRWSARSHLRSSLPWSQPHHRRKESAAPWSSSCSSAGSLWACRLPCLWRNWTRVRFFRHGLYDRYGVHNIHCPVADHS